MVKKFLFFFLSERGGMGRVFAVFFAPYPEKGIPDYIAHRPIIQVFTVVKVLALLQVIVESAKWSGSVSQMYCYGDPSLL